MEEAVHQRDQPMDQPAAWPAVRAQRRLSRQPHRASPRFRRTLPHLLLPGQCPSANSYRFCRFLFKAYVLMIFLTLLKRRTHERRETREERGREVVVCGVWPHASWPLPHALPTAHFLRTNTNAKSAELEPCARFRLRYTLSGFCVQKVNITPRSNPGAPA